MTPDAVEPLVEAGHAVVETVVWSLFAIGFAALGVYVTSYFSRRNRDR